MAEPEHKVDASEPQSKPQMIQRDVKNEIENLRRLTQTIHDRLHNLSKRLDNIVAS